jgi:hypothetical protein
MTSMAREASLLDLPDEILQRIMACLLTTWAENLRVAHRRLCLSVNATHVKRVTIAIKRGVSLDAWARRFPCATHLVLEMKPGPFDVGLQLEQLLALLPDAGWPSVAHITLTKGSISSAALEHLARAMPNLQGVQHARGAALLTAQHACGGALTTRLTSLALDASAAPGPRPPYQNSPPATAVAALQCFRRLRRVDIAGWPADEERSTGEMALALAPAALPRLEELAVGVLALLDGGVELSGVTKLLLSSTSSDVE